MKLSYPYDTAHGYGLGYNNSMTKYVALLRGIGPGNPNMRNDKLRAVFESLGFTNVASVISSGNILFEADEHDAATLESTIEQALTERLGIASKVIIRSQQDIEKLLVSRPFGERTHSPETSLNVTFLRTAPPLETDPPSGEHYTVIKVYPREICSVIDTTQAKTPDFMLKAERIYGKEITTRTWKTVERIAAKFTA